MKLTMTSGIIFFTLLLMPYGVWADAGETGAGFLNLGVGADALGMAGAVTSTSAGVRALYWNPSGLGILRGSEATFMHGELFQSIRHENIGLAWGTGNFGIGFSLKALYLNGLEQRIGPSENPISTFGAYFMAPTLSLAKSLGSSFGLGTNIRLIYQNIGEDNAVSYATDLGLHLSPAVKGLKLGFVVCNLGSSARFQTHSFALPAKFKTGISYVLLNEGLTMAFDLVKPLKDDYEWCAGVQARITDKFYFRTGYQSRINDNGSFAGTSAGFGLKLKDIDLDYAITDFGVLGFTHNLSVSFVFNASAVVDEKREALIAEELQKRAQATAETFYEQGLAQQKMGKDEEAIRSFDIALIWDPQHNNATRSMEELEKNIKVRTINDYLAQGVAEFNKINYIDALRYFGLVLETDSTNVLAREWLKTTSDALIKVQMEKMQINQEIKAKISSHLEKGLLGFSKKDYRTAINEWQQVLTLDPAHTEARNYIDRAEQLISGQVSAAIEAVEQNIGQEKWMQALSDVDRVLVLEPGNQTAVSLKNKIKENLRSLSVSHAKKGIAFFKQGKFAQAEAELKIALDFESTNVTASEYLKKIKSKTGKVGGEDINDLYMKGITAYTQENFTTAILYWKKVLEIDSSHANAKRNIERAEKKLKINKK